MDTPTLPPSNDVQTITARVVQGHRVASGLNGNPRFPGGTLRMQAPFFAALGFDMTRWHTGTLNVSIAPWRYRVGQPRLAFTQVKWHPVEPAEDFSFFDVRLQRPGGNPVAGFIYYPHPETKPEHFQKPDVLELLLPYVDGLSYGTDLVLEVPRSQMTFHEASGPMPLSTH
ncbi:MAG TPA: hypothetical protein VMF06_15655 [Candidatus Limnocylindria bacterium]|jgi:hypothetical protein|nr:hypothetical protein [Candidatus Limnocylindria bacterium]